MKKQYYIPLAIIEAYGVQFLDDERSAQAEMSSGAEVPESDLLSMFQNVGVVGVKGRLTNNDSPFNSWYGLVSYNQVREALVEAVELGAGAVLLDIDSVGGSAAGMKDLSTFIEGIGIPTVAHTSGVMASAAYFLGASCEHCLSDDMSDIGSIGVVMQHYEVTEQLKKDGIKVDIIRSGDKKMIGGPYEKLTAENRKYMQDQVNTLADKFFNFVSEKRGLPLPVMGEIKKGGTFIGDEAVKVGLIDKIVSFDESLLMAINLAEKDLDKDPNTLNNGSYRSGGLVLSSTTAEGESIMPKKISKAALEALAIAGKPTPAAEGTDEVNLNIDGAPTEGGEENTAEGEATDADNDAGGDENQPTAEFSELQEKFDASQIEIAELTTKAEAKAHIIEDLKNAHEAAMAPLSKILEGQINTMRTALSLTSLSMEAFSSEALLTEYAAIKETFESSLVVGGVIPDDEGTERNETKTESREDRDAITVLSF